MSNKKRTVLIAEDDLFLSQMMQKALEREGIATVVVHTGTDAIQAIDVRTPDLLLLDLLMPGIDGHGVLKHIQQKKYRFPVIVCSNVSDKSDKETCSTFGCSEYVVKSDIDDDALWPIIKKYFK
jgi:CheY-like chemotaxis protein